MIIIITDACYVGALIVSSFDKYDLPFQISNLNCNDREKNLQNCSYTLIKTGFCVYETGLICQRKFNKNLS